MKKIIKLEFKEEYNLIHTFECGQIFRFESFDQGKIYYGPLEDRIIKITQISPNVLQIESNNEKDLKNLVNRFFRTQDDYFEMIKSISIDNIMQEIVRTCYGLHVIQQDKFECCIAYLLSQNSNIARIKKNLFDLSKLYGDEIEYDGYKFYLFPKRESLLNLDINDFEDLGFGYRSKYIYEFIQNYPKFLDEPISDFEEFNKKLLKIKGIGQKVADCIQMFAFGNLEVFIIDTWMKKFMLKNYYKETKKRLEKELRELGKKMFGKWAGYAQEFIFRYIRKYNKFI